MIRQRLEQKLAFRVAGVKTWISGQHNEEFADFWKVCTVDGTCGKLKSISSQPADNVTHSRIMGISRVENDPNNRAFYFYIAAETDTADGFDGFRIDGGEWAIFEGDGNDAMALIRAEMEAFMHWLPSSGYVHDNRPEIEVYPDGTDVYVEFWLPVRKNSPQ